MALQTTINISVDFHDNKYVMINAKQYDDCSRWIAVTCYDKGVLWNLSSAQYTAYIRYKKADGNGVLNSCRINSKGEVLVELTEQMLAAEGICYVDLIIVNKGSAIVNVDTGEIITVDDSAILSTMAFCVNVYEVAVDNSVIESSYEYDALNKALQKVNADYEEIIQLTKSYAIGDAGGIRENEDFDNAKYYYEQSLINATNAATSEANSKTSETNAKASETNAKTSENNAKTSEANAKISETNAANSAESVKTSEINAANSATVASEYATTALNSMNSAVNSATSASTSEANAYTYYIQVEEMTNDLGGVFFPMGTIEFSELATLLANGEVEAGYLYNISDDFVTDSTFKKGSGITYSAGTNVYYTSDGYWDCLAGDTATVNEVKSYLGI